MTRAFRFPRRSRLSRWFKNASLVVTLIIMGIAWFREETDPNQEEASPPSRSYPSTPRSPASVASRISVKVISISDGDTVRVLDEHKQTLRVRLQGIDAPEDGQEHGNASRRALGHWIAGQHVELQLTGTDRYGRKLAWIYLNGENINRRMVADGWAWHYVEYDKDRSLAQLQRDAQAASKGLWNSTAIPIAPWEYRRLKRSGNPRSSVASRTPESSPASGNPQSSVASSNAPSSAASVNRQSSVAAGNARSSVASQDSQRSDASSAAGSSLPANRLTGSPSTVSNRADDPQAEGSHQAYWINANDAVRHNRSCRWFGRTTRGHYTNTAIGNACGICKG